MGPVLVWNNHYKLRWVQALNNLTKLSLASNKPSFIHKTLAAKQLEQYLSMVVRRIAAGCTVFYHCISCL